MHLLCKLVLSVRDEAFMRHACVQVTRMDLVSEEDAEMAKTLLKNVLGRSKTVAAAVAMASTPSVSRPPRPPFEWASDKKARRHRARSCPLSHHLPCKHQVHACCMGYTVHLQLCQGVVVCLAACTSIQAMMQ